MKLNSWSVSGLAIFASNVLVAVAHLDIRAGCNADNCARAATGRAGGQQSARLSACSSFQLCTVTTAPSPSGGPAVTNCPASLPSSVSACSGAARYRSACSCAGITPSYVTVTAALTSPPPVATDPVVFRLGVASGAYETYFVVVDESSGASFASLAAVNEQSGSVFMLDRTSGSGALSLVKYVNGKPTAVGKAYQPAGQLGSALYFSNQAGLPYVKCQSVLSANSPTGRQLTCTGLDPLGKLLGCEAFAGGGPDERYLRLDKEQPRYCGPLTLNLLDAAGR